METFSALLAICAGNSPVPGEFPAQRPVARSFNVFFDLRLNKRLSKQSWGWWFETQSRPLCRHCYGCNFLSFAPSSKEYNMFSIVWSWWMFTVIFVFHIFSCDQAALWMVQSVRPSVRLSVCLSVRLSVTPFWLCSHHPIIMKFSGVITSDKSGVHAKGQGQRSKVKVTEVTTQLHRFRTVTPVWIHIWWWDDAYSLIMLRRGALLFFKVIRQISRSRGSKNRWIWPRLGVSGL